MLCSTFEVKAKLSLVNARPLGHVSRIIAAETGVRFMKKHAIATMLAAGGVVLGAFPAAAQGQQPCSANVPNAPAVAGVSGGADVRSGGTHSEEEAVVEAAITGEQDGFRYRAYIVDWRGYRVLVRDTLLRTNLAAGSNVRLMVMRNQIGGRRLLSFLAVGVGQGQGQSQGQNQSQTHKQGQNKAASGQAEQRSSVIETSGLVEDVLSAEQDGYRFRAYVVSLQGQNVPVFDLLSQSNGAIGEEIDVLGMHLQTRAGALADFQIKPDAHMSAQLRASQSVATSSSNESGVIDEVLAVQSQGYRYRAYVVQWHGTRVVVLDSSARTDYEAGDTLAFRALQISGGSLVTPRLMFTLPRLEAAATAAQQPSPSSGVNEQSQQETATVADVLQAQEGSSRFQAYIVNWHGTRVAVLDAFANGQIAVGQAIRFLVAQTEASGVDPSAELKQLAFMRFDFPQPTMTSASTGCTAGAASPH